MLGEMACDSEIVDLAAAAVAATAAAVAVVALGILKEEIET